MQRLKSHIQHKLIALPISQNLAARYRRFFNARAGNPRREITLDARSVYVIPTRYALLLALLLLLLLLVATNYSNNMIFALVFWLVALNVLFMYYGYANLVKLHLRILPIGPIFANHSALIKIESRALNQRPRFALQLGDDAAYNEGVLIWHSPKLKRGVKPIPRLKLATTYPSGLFYCWAWLRFAGEIMVYPAPENFVKWQAGSGSGSGAQNRHGESDFYGHRRHQASDSPQQISWKAVARTGTLYSKEYSQGVAQKRILDYAELPMLKHEQRLSQLCFWILECEQLALDYCLQLPHQQSAYAKGAAQQQRCLAMLAQFDIGSAP